MIYQTIVEIKGVCIPTIPKGTQFTIPSQNGKLCRNENYAECEGLPINMIWNYEYEPVMGNDFSI